MSSLMTEIGQAIKNRKGVANGFASLDATSKVPSSQISEVLNLADGKDVTITSPASGQALVYNGTAWVNNVGSGVGFKNYIINGNFDIWQRGTAFVPALSTDTYTADRWIAYIAGAGKNVQRLTADVNFRNKYGISIDGTNSCTDSYILTRLEAQNCHGLHGKTVTLSFKVSATNAGSMVVKISRPNTADSYLAGQITAIDQKSITLNAGVNSISYQVSFNQIDPTYGLQIAFHFGALGVSDDRFITDIQLEEGSIATPFEQRPYGLELSLCQRYYEKQYVHGTANGYTTNIIILNQKFTTSKRILPTISVLSGGIYVGNSQNLGYTSHTSFLISVDGFLCDANVSGATASASYSPRGIIYTASAEL